MHKVNTIELNIKKVLFLNIYYLIKRGKVVHVSLLDKVVNLSFMYFWWVLRFKIL